MSYSDTVRESHVLFVTDELACCLAHHYRQGKVFESAADIAGSEEMKAIHSNDSLTHYDAYMELLDMDAGVSIDSFVGKVSTVGDDPRTEEYDSDSIYYFVPKRESSPFHAVYKDLDELVEEFREHVANVIPPDFDLRGCIRSVHGLEY